MVSKVEIRNVLLTDVKVLAHGNLASTQDDCLLHFIGEITEIFDLFWIVADIADLLLRCTGQ